MIPVPGRPRRRARWTDTRFFIGLALIAASVAGVWLVVTVSRQSEPVLAAAHTIVPGETIGRDDVRIVDAALGASGAMYLDPARLADGLVAQRVIGDGELVPLAALGEPGSAETTTVVVRTATEVPESVARGSVVELWSAVRRDDGTLRAPARLLPDAVVARVTREDGVLGASGVSLEIVIAREDVAAVLAAASSDAAVSAVPTGAGIP